MQKVEYRMLFYIRNIFFYMKYYKNFLFKKKLKYEIFFFFTIRNSNFYLKFHIATI